MHLCDCTLGVVDFFVHDVCGSAIDIEDLVHRHVELLDHTVLSEDLTDVILLDISSQCLYYNLWTLLTNMQQG
jgi:hypothetical protein